MSCLLAKSDAMRASKPSSRFRGKRKVLGVGINDADYVVDPAKKSGIGVCPAYHSWLRMLMRCYSEPFLKNNPTYRGSSVCHSWLSFSYFREWWSSNVVDGWEIDKDLLHIGNKVYAPGNCIFVPKWLNTMLNGNESARGGHPIGVYFHKKEGKFRSQISLCSGTQKWLGSFTLEDDAYLAWLNAKLDYASSRKKEMDAIDVRIYPNVVSIIKGKR